MKSHQDDLVPYDQLARPAQLNLQVDALATQQLQKYVKTPYYSLPASRTMLLINQQEITAGYKFFIRNSHLTPDLQTYVISKFNWYPQFPDMIW